ncbi:MAG: TPM domain-containing protein [Methylotenera sp.]|uniref:TPM domain-containing protein n=1 Tax=Methylotenera sp. TaxID=2051956 RepID=UPI00248A88B2|nr:TPM domain-containing protein [Methylotenera sp.]MDI1309706.1 TPM domain-containing protein [Methylotenera sp.]
MSLKLLKRLVKHLVIWPSIVKQYFPKESMLRIEKAIAASEKSHLGEICFVVESNLDTFDIIRNVSAKKRAIEIFSKFHVWDTAQNNGVLIYLLLADHDFEIVADRGIHHHVGNEGWEQISKEMEKHFKHGDFERGVLHGIAKITEHLDQYFPSDKENVNEINNAPIII